MAGAQTIAVWTLLLLACGSLFYWAVVLYRVVITVIQLPTGRDGVVLADGDHRESATRSTAVVVPAHNEQGVIGELIASLRSQDHPDFIVVLALDRCTDDTARVAREAIDGDERFEIVEIGACPPGWAGKVHAVYDALQRSMRAADAELLVFVDADCTFAPTCLRAAAALLADRGLHLLSLLNTLTSDRWFEWFVQPMAGFELMRQYPLTRVNRAGPRQRAFANGQFLMFDAEAYRSIGGHEAVKDDLLEDIALARRIKELGYRGGLLASGGVSRCRMYESWAEFKRGWKRIYTESANRRSDRLTTAGWRLLLTAGAMPLVAAAAMGMGLFVGGPIAGIGFVVGAVALAIMIVAMSVLHRGIEAPLGGVVAAPLGAFAVSGILLAAARDLRKGEPTQWAGRSYVREDRAKRRGRPTSESAA